MNIPWNYATIAFQPYPDVGEFVNVGVLALAVPSRILAYRLIPAHMTARIHAFFPELDMAVYREGRKRAEREIERLESTINSAQGEDDQRVRLNATQPGLAIQPDEAASLFKVLTAPRDGLFRFHAKGTRLAPSPETLLDALFDRYVIRVSAEAEDPEEMRLVREVSRLLEEWKIRRLYRKDVRVGTDAFHVRFSFGYQPDENAAPLRVIKPVNLAQANSTQIYHHGDLWLANIQRLRRLDSLPSRVMLPVKMPLATRGAARDSVAAAEEIVDQLRMANITIAEAGDARALRQFAEIAQDSTLTLTS